ncbi:MULTISPECIES: hypothetical protein [Streptomyces]|nr:hypothetical protein [Streptomyces venezuelae]
MSRRPSRGPIATAIVTLRNLDASGGLSGRWAAVRSETGKPATVAGATAYDRSHDEFEQVMAYFWVNESQEYLQGLGFGTELPGANDRVQPVRINQWGADNSFFTDKKAEILPQALSSVRAGETPMARAGWTTPRTPR